MSSEINIKGYNQWSEFYDSYPNPTVAIDQLYFTPFYSGLTQQDVLEIGCGTGRHTQQLLDLGNKVLGIDTSLGMLTKAQAKVVSPNVQWIYGNFLEEEIRGTFQSVVMSLVLEHIFDLPLFFEKVHSLLRVDGQMFFSEIHPLRSQEGVLAHFKRADGSEYHLESRAHSEAEIEAAILGSGLTIRLKKTICGDHQLAQIKEKWSRYLDQPMIQLWSVVKA